MINTALRSTGRRHLQNKSLTGIKIMVDPGHGGTDPGAIGPTGVREADANLAMSLKLRDRLEDMGAEVRMTRDTDRNVSRPGAPQKEELQARVALANSWPADLFVAVHSNSSTVPTLKGTQTFHARQASRTSREMAKSIHENMVATTGRKDLKVRQADFYVVKHTHMPAVLVETAFVSNPEEEKLLADPEFHGLVADAIAKGVSESANTLRNHHQRCA